MTAAKPSIRTVDLDRMASVAIKRGVPIEMLDERGRVFRAYPTIEALKQETGTDPDLAYGGNSLEEWRKRREGGASRGSSRK